MVIRIGRFQSHIKELLCLFCCMLSLRGNPWFPWCFLQTSQVHHDCPWHKNEHLLYHAVSQMSSNPAKLFRRSDFRKLDGSSEQNHCRGGTVFSSRYPIKLFKITMSCSVFLRLCWVSLSSTQYLSISIRTKSSRPGFWAPNPGESWPMYSAYLVSTERGFAP